MKHGFTVAIAVAGVLVCAGAHADTYRCTDPRVIAQSEIADCRGKQTVTRPNGRVEEVARETPADVKARSEQERVDTIKADEQKRAIQADRRLLELYPDEPTHAKGRAVALEPVRKERLRLDAGFEKLKRDRAPLLSEAEFYTGKALPPKLKSALDANDALVAAQQALIDANQQRAADIDQRCDAQRDWLRKLWSQAAQPGSRGVFGGASCAPTGQVANR
jgi:hypothetical protein